MDWKTILMIGITALLIFVWLPFVIITFRKTWKETKHAIRHPEKIAWIEEEYARMVQDVNKVFRNPRGSEKPVEESENNK